MSTPVRSPRRRAHQPKLHGSNLIAAAVLALCAAPAAAGVVRQWQCVNVRYFDDAACWANGGPAPGDSADLTAPFAFQPIHVVFPGQSGLSRQLEGLTINGGNPNAPLELLITGSMLQAQSTIVGFDAGGTLRVGGSSAALPDAGGFVGGTLKTDGLILGLLGGSNGRAFVDTAAAIVNVTNILQVGLFGQAQVDQTAGSVLTKDLTLNAVSSYNLDGGVLQVSGTLTNNGLVRQGAGSLNLTKGSGTNFANDGFFQFDGGNFFGARVNNSGQLGFAANADLATLANTGAVYVGNGANVRVLSQGFTNSGLIELANGSFQAGALVNGALGTIAGDGTLRAASLENQGLIRTAAGGQLTLASMASIVNQGQIQLDAVDLGAGLVGSRLGGKTLLNQAGGSISGHGQIDNSVLNQAGGLVRVSSFEQLLLTGSYRAEALSTTYVDFDGVLRLAGRTQLANQAGFSGGGSVWLSGPLEIGDDEGMAGLAQAEGSLRLEGSSRYLADIGGFLDGSIDRLIADELELEDGTLEVRSADGFVAQAGQRFDLLDWRHLSGRFGRVDFSGFQIAAGTFLNLDKLYLDGSISVDRQIDPPGNVPAPGTALLAGLALLAVARTGRARRPITA